MRTEIILVCPLCGTVFADIQSSNIVGYATQPANGKAYPTSGAMFVSVGSNDSTFKLGDITMTTMSGGTRVNGGGYMSCRIQVIDPVTSVLDQDKIFTYYGDADYATDEDRGWYNVNDDLTLVNDTPFPAGQAFLCAFDSTLDTELTYAGQVIKGNVVIDSVVNGVAHAYPYIVNPFPTTITLGDIELRTVIGQETQNGGGYMSCTLQTIDPATSVIDQNKIFTYYGDADYATDDDRGWYNVLDDMTLVNDTPIKAGDGFLCGFDVTLKAKLIFTNPIQD